MNKYSKEKLIKSVKYASQADVLAVVLKDGEYYSFEEVEEAIDGFFGIKKEKKKKGKVND